MQISIIDIYIGGDRRVREEMGDIEDLAADIKANGQITPITVRPRNSDEIARGIIEPWVLVAGGRRIAAHFRIGRLMIEAFAREEMSEIRHRILELHENLKRLNLTFEEECKAKAEILALKRIENPNITQAEVAQELNTTPATFSRDIKVAEAIELNPELRNAGSKKAVIRHVEAEQQMQVRLNRATSQSEIAGVGALQKRLVTADARDWLRAQPLGKYDLMLTDTPYGIDYWKQGQKMRSGGKHQKLGVSEYDDSAESTADLLVDCVPLMVRATSSDGWIVSFAGQESYDLLRQLFSDCCADHFDYRHPDWSAQCASAKAEGSQGKCNFLIPEIIPWIWYRPNSRNRPRYPELHAMNYYEKILVVNRGNGRLMKPGCPNVLVFDAEYGEERVHANQKPVEAGREITERLTLIGDHVADPFFGSGALLAGAASAAREVSGCEKNPGDRGAALGLVAKYYVTPPSGAGRRSRQRNPDKPVTAEQLADASEVEI